MMNHWCWRRCSGPTCEQCLFRLTFDLTCPNPTAEYYKRLNILVPKCEKPSASEQAFKPSASEQAFGCGLPTVRVQNDCWSLNPPQGLGVWGVIGSVGARRFRSSWESRSFWFLGVGQCEICGLSLQM